MMEVSSWPEVFSASRCPLSVGLSTLAVCEFKAVHSVSILKCIMFTINKIMRVKF